MLPCLRTEQEDTHLWAVDCLQLELSAGRYEFPFFFQFYNMQIPLHRWNLTRTISVDRRRRRHSPMGGVRGGKQNQRRRRRIFVIPKSEGQASKHTKKSILNTFTAVAGALFTILTD